MRFVDWYARSNRNWPVITKAVTSSLLLAGGDLACQVSEQTNAGTEVSIQPFMVDYNRMLRMGSWGLLFNGPTGHLWYNVIERLVPKATSARSVAVKVFLDQALYTPPLTLAFFSYQCYFSGERDSVAGVLEESLPKMWPTLKVNWVYWSVVHIATFTIIPLEYRVLFVAVKNFFWSAFLSVMAKPVPRCATDIPETRQFSV
jgi:protein Mpv17